MWTYKELRTQWTSGGGGGGGGGINEHKLQENMFFCIKHVYFCLQ